MIIFIYTQSFHEKSIKRKPTSYFCWICLVMAFESEPYVRQPLLRQRRPVLPLLLDYNNSINKFWLAEHILPVVININSRTFSCGPQQKIRLVQSFGSSKQKKSLFMSISANCHNSILFRCNKPMLLDFYSQNYVGEDVLNVPTISFCLDLLPNTSQLAYISQYERSFHNLVCYV